VTLQVRLEAVRLVPVSQAPPPATTPIGEPIPPNDTRRWGFDWAQNEDGGEVFSTVSFE
jgi:hypothetical protein